MGVLSGTVAPVGQPVVIDVQALAPSEGRRRAVVAPGDTLFLLENLIPGRYRVSGFLDVDGNGEWAPGAPAPYMPAEPVTQAADTVEVRARWESEGKRRLRLDVLNRLPDAVDPVFEE